MKGVSLAANCIGIVGVSGSGKSSIIKQLLTKLKPTRIAAWVPDEDEDNYGKLLGCAVYRDIVQFIQAMQAKGPFRAVFWPSMDEKKRDRQFHHFCKAVYAHEKMLCLVEELKGITSATHAPEPWAVLSTRGRKKGIHLIGTSQRPAHIDKDFLGFTTEIYVGELGAPQDLKPVAEAVSIKTGMEVKNIITEIKKLGPLNSDKCKNFYRISKGKIDKVTINF